VAFWFSLPQDASQQPTHLCIYDVKGRVVSRLNISDADVRAGCVTWNGSTESGKRLSSGVYLYRLDAGRQSLGSGKMLVVE
jgi:flagellar hook assembly protein FlgD